MRDDSQLYEVYDDVDAEGPPSRIGAAVAATASLLVLALVVVWAYRLGVRDAAEVPVIRAVEGPARVRPEDPGGAQFEHQGRAVYGALSGEPAAPAEFALAPPPERLAPEDLSQAEREAPPPPAPEAAPEMAAEVDQLVAAVLGEEPAAADGTAPAAILPPARPSADAAPAASATAMPAAPAAPVETAALGGAEIQLGAYLSEADALRMWSTISARNGDLLGGRQPTIAPLEGATRVLYRLRAGPFASTAEARDFCLALQARGEDCLVQGPR